MKIQRRIIAAIHEAGHAVVAKALGLRVESVSIAPPEQCVLAEDYEADDDIERLIQFYQGGIAAQFRFAMHTSRSEHSAVDDAEIGRLLAKRYPAWSRSELVALRQDLLEKTYDLIAENKTQIDRVAKELMKRKRLSESDLKNLLF